METRRREIPAAAFLCGTGYALAQMQSRLAGGVGSTRGTAAQYPRQQVGSATGAEFLVVREMFPKARGLRL